MHRPKRVLIDFSPLSMNKKTKTKIFEMKLNKFFINFNSTKNQTLN